MYFVAGHMLKNKPNFIGAVMHAYIHRRKCARLIRTSPPYCTTRSLFHYNSMGGGIKMYEKSRDNSCELNRRVGYMPLE